MKNLIKSLFLKYNYELSDFQTEQFERYFSFLIEENKKYNLTAITEPNEVVIKHFIDSILPEKEIPQNARVIDVGTGAGFPGVPLKILRPDIKLTLLDSLQKRINFLNQLLEKIKINDVKTIHSRAEDYVKETREKFDIALSRAVASIPTLSEYLIPYIKVGGKVLMYKGNKIEEELKEGAFALKTLGCSVSKILDFDLKEVDSKRFVLILNKIQHTPSKFPRSKNLPKSNPIRKN